MSVWSREPPGEAGFYWHKFIEDRSPEVLEARRSRRYAGGLEIVFGDEVWSPKDFGGIWGPRIDPPPWPEDAKA